MKKRLFALCLITILTVTALGASVNSQATSIDVVKNVQSLAMFNASKWTVHYRTPNIDQVETLLEEQGIPMTDPEARELAVQTFMSEWAKRNPTTPNPEKLQALLERERKGELGNASLKTATPQIMSLSVPVEFTASDTFDWCGAAVTTRGPLHNEIPAPGPRDNNTIWYEDATPELYDELYFGVGPDAGVIINHPNLGEVDLRGNTMANYYLEQSEGTFVPMGAVYSKWLQAAHSEGWYGADGEDWNEDLTECVASGNHNVRAPDLIREVVDAINVDDPAFAWQTYDGDGDGIIDNFTIIHAGMGQEAGGGQQGNFSIWSHASAIDYPTGKLACTKGSTGCPDRDIYVREYSMDPENIDIGVIAEEFGHAAFGLPDIYTTDAQGSPSNWAIMEAGSWNGILGGMEPAPFPLYFRYLVGWADPVELDYTTDPTFATVGQLSLRPEGTESGIKIDMPDIVVNVPNPLDTGQAWWSGKADLSEFYLAHDFNLTGTSAPVFSFASYWSIEEDWDYGYVEVSDDAGATWTILPDIDGIMVDTNPNGNNQGWGVTGEDTGTLKFDLISYAGKTVSIRLRYSTDMASQWSGWWADDFAMVDGTTTLFSDDVETPPNGWTTNNWSIVPLNQTFPLYYLAEWRNNTGFDEGLAYPYTTIFNDEATTEWEVDRCPYTVPGMLLWLRNASQGFDYTLTDSIYDPPSYGPKHALLVVDSHYWPQEWVGMGTTEAHLRLNSRCQPGNATFTLQDTTSFTARRAESTATGIVVETKLFESLPAVSQFNDALGYYPGLRFRESNGRMYFWDSVASLAVPATGSYTTKITWGDKTPLTDFYGYDLGDTILGSGNPGDDLVQFGLNIAVVDQADDGTWGLIKVWNAQFKGSVTQTAMTDPFHNSDIVNVRVQAENTGTAIDAFFFMPLSPKVAYVAGSATNGAYPVTGTQAEALAVKYGMNPNVIRQAIIDKTIAGVAYEASALATGALVDFSFDVQATAGSGIVSHTAMAITNDRVVYLTSNPIEITPWYLFLPFTFR
jgi:immune inhibitor A